MKLCESWPDYPIAKELDFELDTNKEVLYNFWQVNKSLIMASVRIMAENDNISDETKKAIKKAYEELRKRDMSRYSVTHGNDNNRKLEGSKLAIYRWFAQTLIWDGTCASHKQANEKLQAIIGVTKDMIAKNQTATSWTKLNRPKWCQHGEGDSEIYLNTGNYTSIFPKIFDYLNSQEAKAKGYTITEVQK